MSDCRRFRNHTNRRLLLLCSRKRRKTADSILFSIVFTIFGLPTGHGHHSSIDRALCPPNRRHTIK
jgi:hypothetical protein